MKNIMKNYIKIGTKAIFALAFVVPFISSAQSVSCFVDFTETLVGKSITWDATSDISGDFTWSGSVSKTDTGTTDSTATLSSASEGTETILVDFFDGLATTTTSCPDVTVYTPENVPALSASCVSNVSSAVIGQPVTWIPSISGGLGPYSITWNGDEFPGSWSDSVAQYSATGTKSAEMATIQSRYGLETASISNIACEAGIPIYSQEPDWLSVSDAFCLADKATAYVNDSITWTISGITGGSDPYKAYWEGTDSLSGESLSVSKIYSSTGDKVASVYRVESSDGQGADVNINCGSVSIETVPAATGGSHHHSTSDDTSTSTATSTATTTATSTTPTSTSTPEITSNDDNGDTSPAQDNGPEYNIYDGYIFNRDQNPGDRSEDIANLQNRLTNEGYYGGLIGGFFGPATEQALKDYQRANGLPETGNLDPITRAKLNGVVESISTSTPEIPPKTTGLTATILDAFSAAIKFIGGKLNAILLFLLIIIIIGLTYSWFTFVKKGDKNKQPK